MAKTTDQLTEEFIRKALIVHGQTYDYSKVNYEKSKISVVITCLYHGTFFQTPSNHLMGKGCPKCNVPGPKRSDSCSFVTKAKKIHGRHYDYSKIAYSISKSDILIICPIHGEFFQRPDKHLEGHGCRQCQYDSKRFNNKKFIEKAKQVHGRKYCYTQVNYRNTHHKVKIICPNHGAFFQTPANHLQGCGCPACKLDNFRSRLAVNQPSTILYLVRLVNGKEIFLKLGKTRGVVKHRISRFGLPATVIHTVRGPYSKISEGEINALNRFNHFKYIPSIKFSGRTECFRNEAFLELCEYMDDL